MIQQIITGAIGGLAYSLSGLAKSDQKDNFDWKKMMPTIIMGTIVGGIAGFTNQDFGVVANTSLAAGITAIVENAWKAIYRNGPISISIKKKAKETIATPDATKPVADATSSQ